MASEIRKNMLSNKDLAKKSKSYLDVREKLISELLVANPEPEDWENLNERIKLWDSVHEIGWWDHEI